MSLRRILLLIMLMALAGCACMGMLVLIVKTNDEIWKLLGTCFFLALATSLLLPLSLLADQPKFRLGGLTLMAFIVVIWLLINLAMWSSELFGLGSEDRFLTIMGLTFLTGISVSVALLLVSFQWAKVAIHAFIYIAGSAYCCFLLATLLWGSSAWYGPIPLASQIFGTGFAILGLGFLASLLLVNAGCGDKRYFRWPGVAIAIVALVCVSVGIWTKTWSEVLGKTFGVSLITGITLAHANLVLMARVKTAQRWLQIATLTFFAAAAITAALTVLLIYDDSGMEDSIFFRLTTASAIAAACGSLALIVLSMFNRKSFAPPPAAAEFKELTLVCPNCSTRQALPLGNASCKVCSLQFQLKVIEPRCTGCGYLLYNIQSDRCPECGINIRNTPDTPPLPPVTTTPPVAS